MGAPSRKLICMRLVADELTIERGGRRLLVRLSFTVAAGEALIVTGRNGVGKSTLLRAVAGFLAPVSGRLVFEVEGGAPDNEAPAALCAHYVGHADSLKGALSARENLAFWKAMLAGAGGGEALSPEAAMDRFGLARIADLPVRHLSAGQKRRVALARLLVAGRPLWLLDEPTAALDIVAQEMLASTMRSHLAKGGFILAATHAPLGLAGARELPLGDIA